MKPQTLFTFLLLIVISTLLAACAILPGTGGALPISSPTPQPLPSDSGEVVRGIALVESIEIQMLESFPVQVNVLSKGILPDSCTTLQETTQLRDGQMISISIFTTRPADAVCTQQIQPLK